MSALADETVVVRVARDRIWDAFGDADLLAQVLPGCETLAAIGDGAFRGVLATRLQFLTLRADVTATLAVASSINRPGFIWMPPSWYPEERADPG